MIGNYETYEEARQALIDYMDQSGEDLSLADMTFRDLLRHYADANPDLAKKSMRDRIGLANNYCGDLMDVPYRKIRAEDMREVIRSADSTNTKRMLKLLFHMLDREAFTEEEMSQFLKLRKAKDMYLILFMCYTGFRETAFRTIRKEHVDLEKMTVTGGIKTQAGYMREIPLHPNIQPIVMRMMQRSGEYLLTNEYGKQMSDGELRMRHQMVIAPFTDRHYVPHECRHTFRNRLDNMGVEEYLKCALMGHAMPNAGERHYAKPTLEKKRAVIMKLWE